MSAISGLDGLKPTLDLIKFGFGPREIEKYQKEHSWPRYLADKIGVKYVNNGEVGSSNYRIFSSIFEQFAYNNINNDDLVVIMWPLQLIRVPLCLDVL